MLESTRIEISSLIFIFKIRWFDFEGVWKYKKEWIQYKWSCQVKYIVVPMKACHALMTSDALIIEDFYYYIGYMFYDMPW